MGDHSSENYLDQLLNSMHGEETEHPKEQQAAKQVLRDDFEKQLFGEEETKEKAKAKNEEDFLREFEEELLKEDIPEYTESLNQKKQEEKATQIDASLDDLLDNIPQDDFSTGDAAKEEETGFQGKSPLETAIPPDEDDFEVNTLDDAVGTFDSNLPKEEDGELDLSGLSDSDLMDMLSGDQDLSDLGDMLSSDQDGKPLEETDSIGDFARSEMNPQEEVADKIPELTEQEDIPAQAEETASNGKNKKKKKNKKEKKEKEGGFWQKLSRIIFGEDDEEEKQAVDIGNTQGADVSELSEENQQILKELEGTGGDAGREPEKKKEKPKKEKKAKKEKKPKQPKPPKPKKEKKPKEVDNTPPLPKGPVIAIVLMAVSLFAFVMIVTNLLGYQANLSQAKEKYEQGSYVEAYRKLQGLSIKERDEKLYHQLATLAAVSEKYQAYLVFDNYGSKIDALDALVCAYGRYDLNQKNAKEYGCEDQLEKIGGKIIKALLKDYDMTGDEALDIYQTRKRDDYTVKLHQKLKELGLG